jgi:hypothetical protein
VGDVVDDGMSYPASYVALHEGLAQFDPEDLRWVAPAVDAGEDVKVLPREERERGHVSPGAGLGEGAFAVERLLDVGHGMIFPL